ncbi:hypothetical protein RhiirA4_418450 [Rhizophagus irregularis]|uniref:Uncharacterized protein n=1 Tax=Rhizophagus irregularis TaxID=588596 RepID=A0A2I1GAJ9_9GLOM|nr:hypothetical protein RhiirA4_418450 [Rhizophagus irregularis]
MGEEVDENNQSIEGVSFVCCLNKERIRIMKASLGELCRNDSLDRTPWTEIPKKQCKLILPDNNDSESEDQASMSQVQIGSEDEYPGFVQKIFCPPRNSVSLSADLHIVSKPIFSGI